MESEKIQLDFWNVGQGDASTITWPDGKITVIDCGPRNNSLVDFLIRERPHINNIFITHNDADHIGGLYSIIKQNSKNIDALWMLDDRSRSDVCKIITKIRETFDPNKIWRLERGNAHARQLYNYGNYSIKIHFPQFVDNLDASSPNSTSAILCLTYINDVIVVWGSDNSLGNIASKCPSPVQLLFGPHHGAPEERKNTKLMTRHLQSISPSQCFLSFATINGYDHPSPKYIEALRKTGCSITCSQLAKKCAGGRSSPVFKGDGLYGQKVPAGPNQVSCHGHTRFYVQGRNIYDEYENEYRNAVKRLPKALCNKA